MKKKLPKKSLVGAKPSNWWYLLPILLSIIGGIIGFFLLKDRDRKFAERLLIIGLIIVVVGIILQVIFGDLIYQYISRRISMPSQPSLSEDSGYEEDKGEINGEVVGEEESEDVENDVCRYDCCSDSDCKDNDSYTIDRCSSPSSLFSVCENFHEYNSPNYFDFCWEYDCTAQIPYPSKTSTIPEIMKVTHHVRGVDQLNAIVVFLYGYEALPLDKLEILQSDESDLRSFKYGVKWFEDMASRYDVNLDISLDFSEQQYQVTEEYIIHNYGESYSKDLLKFIQDTSPQYMDYDIVVVFYYSSQDISYSSHMSSSSSIALFSKQPAPDYFYPSFDEGTTSYSRTFAHELAHVFGAIDKYTCVGIDTSSPQCNYAKQNNISCILPGVGYDIMCHRVPTELGFHTPELNELTIMDVTAKEIGWFDMDSDGLIEAIDPCPFLKENDC